MSVLIRGMEMPKHGHTITITIVGSGQAYVEYFDCRPHVEETIEYTAVPVPPHGRLIDADAFAAEMKKRQDACAEWRDDIKNGGGYGTELYYRADSFLGAMCETKLTLDKIPTIIPAEEE